MIYIAENATVTGDVTLAENVNIWHGAVLRGDSGAITVGANTNIQDNCVLHEAVTLGQDCTVGHGAILHGCKIGNRCLIGMGAIVLDGAVLEDDCMVAAGALVTGKMRASAGSLILGNPAQVVKPLTDAQKAYILQDAENYVNLAKQSLPAKK